MNWIETFLLIYIIISIIMTGITEPMLSFKYGKALVTSGVKVVIWVKESVVDIANDYRGTKSVVDG
jgi:hypothetical protein